MPSPLDSWPKLSWGTGTPAPQGLPWLAPCPGQRLSVCLGCEDEESVFLLADPLHELVDSTDGAGLGPQGTVAYVELKGAGYLREKNRLPAGHMSVPHLGLALHLPLTGMGSRHRGSSAGTRGGSRVPYMGGASFAQKWEDQTPWFAPTVGFLHGMREFTTAHGRARSDRAHRSQLLPLPLPPWHRGTQ